MSIRRYVATSDTTITNAFQENLIYRATGSNMGASDSIEIFSIYGQTSLSSSEISRALVKFPIDEIISDRTLGLIPLSGNVEFLLKLYNAEHPLSLPKDYYLSVFPLSQSWDEGYGLDMESYLDPGQGMPNGYGANWISGSSTEGWDITGSSYITDEYKQYFKRGHEDLEINITNLVEKWIDSSYDNNGVLVKLSGSFEDGSQLKSFYTKKFFARDTEFFYKRPIIEVRWEEVVKDDRGNFYASSSLLSDEDNTNNLFFYNRFRGQLKNIPSNPNVLVKLYTDSNYTNQLTTVSCSVTNPSTGIYKASIKAQTTSSALYDKWYLSGSESTVYYRGSFDVYSHDPQDFYSNEEYIYSITNLKSKYNKDENVTIRIFSREKDWSPNIYSVASKNIENIPIKNLYYKIFRIDDGQEIIGYSTGSLAYSKTSYDGNGNYFNLDMALFEPDYSYGIKFARWDGSVLEEIKNVYKFRVE